MFVDTVKLKYFTNKQKNTRTETAGYRKQKHNVNATKYNTAD